MIRIRTRTRFALVVTLACASGLGSCGDATPSDNVPSQPNGNPRTGSAAAPDVGPPAANPPGPTAEPPAAATSDPPVRKDGTIFAESQLMGTQVTVNVWLPPDVTANAAGGAIQAAFDEIARIEAIMSEWQPDSELTRFNQAAGNPAQSLSAEFAEVLGRATRIAAATDGAFDPTFHGVGQLWSFAPGSTPPTRKQVAEKLPLVDHRKLEIDEATSQGRLTQAGMMVGLGAIAKGYAVDRASAVLTDRGLPHHVVEAGGDTYARGTKGGKKWVVGIQKPGERGVVAALPASDEAVVTSGDYQRFFEHEGRRYAHILDPRTGWPVAHERSAQSVTLVAKNATDADAFATAVAVMGPEQGMRFVESREDLEVAIIDRDGKLQVSSGLQPRLVFPPPRE